MTNASDDFDKPNGFLKLATKVIVGFWALHLTYRAVIAIVGHSMSEMFDPALDVALAIGFVMSFGYCAILAASTRRGLGFSLLAAAVLSLPVSLLHASTELFLFFHMSPELNGEPSVRTLPDGTVVTATASGQVTYRRPGEARPTVVKLPSRRQMVIDRAVQTVTENTTGWYFFFFGLGSFFVGMRNAAQLRESERRVAQYERLAQQSQLEALRYQVNPHFLFNTLNALSALIMTGRVSDAEAMILKLSRFYRSTLAIDPAEDITLQEELDLQRLYLDIESVRFPARLRVETVVSDDVLEAQIPGLLLQPLIENTIKHGVSRRQGEVTIRIQAERSESGRLAIHIENQTGPMTMGSPDGTSTGIRNVAERLKARFGDKAGCSACLIGADLFRVTITLPFIA